jgi:hypothetical protein
MTLLSETTWNKQFSHWNPGLFVHKGSAILYTHRPLTDCIQWEDEEGVRHLWLNVLKASRLKNSRFCSYPFDRTHGIVPETELRQATAIDFLRLKVRPEGFFPEIANLA